MFKRIVLGQIRHFLSAGGACFATYLISHGADPEDIEVVISGVVAMISALWSIYDKVTDERKQNEKITHNQ